MVGYNVQSWRGSVSDGDIDLFYIVDIDTGTRTTVSPSFLSKMYNDGTINIIPDVLISYLGLDKPNPYVQASVTELKVYVKDWETGASIQSAKVRLGGWTSDTTTADGSIYFANIPKKEYVTILTKTGYQTQNITLDLTGDGSYATYTFRLQPITQEPTPADPDNPTKRQDRLTIGFKDANNFIPFLKPKGFIGGGIAKLATAENKAKLLTAINAVVPGGWEIVAVSLTSEALIIDFDETGSPGLPVLAILAIAAGVLIVYGLIIGWWKLEDRKGKEAAVEEVIAKGDIVEKLGDLGFNSDEISIILSGLDNSDTGGGTFGEIKDILIMAVGAAVIILLIQQMGRSTAA